MRKWLLALVAAAIAPIAMAQTTLNVLWYVNSNAETQVMKQLFAEYQKTNPGVSFNLQVVPYSSYDQKLSQMVAAGTPPDVAKTTSMRPQIQPFLLDLSNSFGPNYLDNYVKSWAAGAKLGNKIIAAPLDVTATGIILNKSAFEKAGVSIPSEKQGWTWPQFLKAVKEVSQKAHVRYPLVWDVTAGRWIVYLYQNGQHIFSEQPPYSVTLNPQKGTQVLTNFLDMAKADMPTGLWSGASSDNPKQLFLTGQAVAWMSGSWQVGSLVNEATFQWQAGPTPYSTVRSSIVGGDYVVGFKNSPHVKQAAAFIKWLTSASVEAQYAKPLYYIPANVNSTVDYGNAAATTALSNLQYELKISPLYAGTDQGNLAMQYVWDPLYKAVTQAASGQIKPAQAIQRVIDAAKKGLASTPSAQ